MVLAPALAGAARGRGLIWALSAKSRLQGGAGYRRHRLPTTTAAGGRRAGASGQSHALESTKFMPACSGGSVRGVEPLGRHEKQRGVLGPRSLGGSGMLRAAAWTRVRRQPSGEQRAPASLVFQVAPGRDCDGVAGRECLFQSFIEQLVKIPGQVVGIRFPRLPCRDRALSAAILG